MELAIYCWRSWIFLCRERSLASQIFLSRCDSCLEACEIPCNFLSCYIDVLAQLCSNADISPSYVVPDQSGHYLGDAQELPLRCRRHCFPISQSIERWFCTTCVKADYFEDSWNCMAALVPGHNGAGKTTLMKEIAAHRIVGMPPDQKGIPGRVGVLRSTGFSQLQNAGLLQLTV